MEHEELWEAITRIEGQLAKIHAGLDDLHNDVHNFKLDFYRLENKVNDLERSLQTVERACRY
jgi:predicted  nucleic acid-binding Zn-ribbon protein